MNKKTIVGSIVVTGVMCLGQGVNPSNATAASTAKVYKEAQHLISDQNIKVPWDGRYGFHSAHHEGFCIETFNGSSADIQQYGHGVPSGFYLKFCTNGQFYVNDGVPFKGMTSY